MFKRLLAICAAGAAVIVTTILPVSAQFCGLWGFPYWAPWGSGWGGWGFAWTGGLGLGLGFPWACW